jgi:hypothetical protein
MVRINNRALKITVIFQVKRKNLFNMLCDRKRRQRRYLLSSNQRGRCYQPSRKKLLMLNYLFTFLILFLITISCSFPEIHNRESGNNQSW